MNLLKGVENFQAFSVGEEFESLDFNNTGKRHEIGGFISRLSRLLYGDSSLFHSFLVNLRQSFLCKAEALREPFIEDYRQYPFIESLSQQEEDINDRFIAIGYRFFPGMSQFHIDEYLLPQSVVRLEKLWNFLSLVYRGSSLSPHMVYDLSRSGVGLHGVAIDENNSTRDLSGSHDQYEWILWAFHCFGDLGCWLYHLVQLLSGAAS